MLICYASSVCPTVFVGLFIELFIYGYIFPCCFQTAEQIQLHLDNKTVHIASEVSNHDCSSHIVFVSIIIV